MAPDTPAREADERSERVYQRRIRPDHLDGIEPSAIPTAVLVTGQPGTGVTYAIARIRQHLRPSVGASVAISADSLAACLSAAPAIEAPGGGLQRWRSRLIDDASSARLNLVVDGGADAAETVLLAERLRARGYQLAAVVLAADREQSRQWLLAGELHARAFGLAARLPPVAEVEDGYAAVRDTLERLERGALVERLQVILRDGRQLYANEQQAGRWAREPRALAALDDYRGRRQTAAELAGNALRWEDLAARLADFELPPDWIAHVAHWRDDALTKAQADPQAAPLLACGREALAFVTMPRFDFRERYPQHARIVDKLDDAIRYAEDNFALAADRRRFVEQARERLAERIAEGRTSPRERGGRAR